MAKGLSEKPETLEEKGTPSVTTVNIDLTEDKAKKIIDEIENEVHIQILPTVRHFAPKTFIDYVYDEDGKMIYDAFSTPNKALILDKPQTIKMSDPKAKVWLALSNQKNKRPDGECAAWNVITDGMPGQIARVFIPADDAKKNIAASKKRGEYLRKLFAYNHEQLKDMSIVMQLGLNDPDLITDAIDKMMKDDKMVDRVTKFMDMSDETFAIYSTLLTAKKYGNIGKNIGVYEQPDGYWYNETHLGINIDAAVKKILTFDDRQKLAVLQGIKSTIPS
jgi:hypothetical protein